ncbi:hypothetical protein OHS81_35730 [Streptomyces sp. NBC_00400]|uniref:hypothetical protein n=1 Tax=Streptomyces sp. NBC_00400 TaxID=2975737 RepID=UPI002E1E1645
MSVRLTPGPQPSDRFGLEAGVDRQLDDAQDTRARLRWGPVAKMLRNPRYAGMVSYAGNTGSRPATAGDGWSLVLFDDEGRRPVGRSAAAWTLAGPFGPCVPRRCA